MFEMRVTQGPNDLKRLSRQLRSVEGGKGIRTRLMKGLRQGTKPAQTRVRAAALGLPSKGTYHTGLRRNMAAATGIQARLSGNQAGVAVRISRKRMGKQAGIVRESNNPGYWRHPIYGHRGSWVTQHSTRGWFDTAIVRSVPEVKSELKRVLDQIEKDLSHR